MSLLVGLDVGMDGAHAVAIDASGRLVASATSEYPTVVLRPGWSEQDPYDWWRASREVLRRLASQVGSRIAALGLTGQMHSAVFLDQRGDVIRPALLWNDRRTSRQCEQLAQRIGAERVIEITGNAVLPSFTATKALWLRDVEPVQYRHVRHLLHAKDYVRLMLTGALATDVSDASGTMLLDLRRRDWSAQILAALDIPREWLPVVQESAQLSGEILPEVARELGLPVGLPVAAGAGEHAAAGIANGITGEACVSTSIDSRGILSAYREALTIDRSGRLQAYGHALPRRYQLLALTPTAFTAVQWWGEMLGGRMTDDELIKQAESVPPGADGLLFLAGRASAIDGESRGAFVGLRAHHTPAHLTRAVMEGIIVSLRAELEVMRDVGVDVHVIRATGAGGQRGFWRRLQADVFNRPVEHIDSAASPAYGAALIAGVAAGIFHDVGQAASLVKVSDSVNQPDPNRAQIYESIYGRFRQLDPAVRGADVTAARSAR